MTSPLGSPPSTAAHARHALAPHAPIMSPSLASTRPTTVSISTCPTVRRSHVRRSLVGGRCPPSRVRSARGTTHVPSSSEKQPVRLSPDESSGKATALTAALRAAAGDANGTDRTDEQREAISLTLADICALNPEPDAPARVNLTGTTWRLLYTDSAGNSSGKIGPFVGRVTQVFSSTSFGAYENVVAFLNGAVRVKLGAVAEEMQPDKLKVTFVDTRLEVGGRELVTKPFPPGRAGTWRMVRRRGTRRNASVRRVPRRFVFPRRRARNDMTIKVTSAFFLTQFVKRCASSLASAPTSTMVVAAASLRRGVRVRGAAGAVHEPG